LNNKKIRPSEFELIEELFAPLAKSQIGAVGLLDDCATLSLSTGNEALYSLDTLVAGVHFFPDDPADLIAKKLLRVSLSDLASSGGTPKGYLLAANIPEDISYDWLKLFTDGLAEDQIEFGIALLGGDTTATTGPLSLSLTAIGEVPAGKAIRRSGAVIGDEIFVTGTVGDAALALRKLDEIGREATAGEFPELYNRYVLPQPRSVIGSMLLDIATACIDISDGIYADLQHICSASDVGAEILQNEIPLSQSAQKLVQGNEDLWQFVYGGGDDYELLFSANSENRTLIESLGERSGIQISFIGRVIPDGGVSILDPAGKKISVENVGWRHF